MSAIESAINENRHEEADGILEKALAQAGSQAQKIELLIKAGDAFYGAGKKSGTGSDFSRALHCFEEANKIMAASPANAEQKIVILTGMAKSYGAGKNYEAAEKCYTEALQSAQEKDKGTILMHEGELFLAEKKFDQAESALKQGTEILKTENKTVDAINSLRLLANVYKAQKRWPDADQVYNQAIDLCEHLDSTVDTPLARTVRDEWYALLRDMHTKTWGQKLIDKLETKHGKDSGAPEH